jgi:hypothetical protein
MKLASVCEYPAHYFDHLSAESDQDLEIERNDVRDLLRTVGGSVEGGSTVDTGSTDYPLEVTTRILAKLLDACNEAVVSARQRQELCSEAAVHAFSSLAKPVNHLAKCFARSRAPESVRIILGTALHVLVEVNQMAVGAFQQSLPERKVLPFSRIVNIGNASFAPFLSAVLALQEEKMTEGLTLFLDVAIHGSILSLEQIPELPAPSILDHSIYDIRGTMRGPGGEDHVGCLTLMRCAFEDDALARKMVLSSARYISRLCELHQQLKQIEVERGQLVFHGRGVTPQTRRILVGALCHLELISEGQLGASSMLTSLFSSAIDSIASFQSNSTHGEQALFLITETTLDLASFTPTIVTSLFESNVDDPRRTECLEVLTTACVHGYHRLSATDDGSLLQVRNSL